eukprot:COSAG01_NODE_5460_length_4252_cov_7.235974_6_plen_92_part_00
MPSAHRRASCCCDYKHLQPGHIYHDAAGCEAVLADHVYRLSVELPATDVKSDMAGCLVAGGAAAGPRCGPPAGRNHLVRVKIMGLVNMRTG